MIIYPCTCEHTTWAKIYLGNPISLSFQTILGSPLDHLGASSEAVDNTSPTHRLLPPLWTAAIGPNLAPLAVADPVGDMVTTEGFTLNRNTILGNTSWNELVCGILLK